MQVAEAMVVLLGILVLEVEALVVLAAWPRTKIGGHVSKLAAWPPTRIGGMAAKWRQREPCILHPSSDKEWMNHDDSFFIG